MAELLDDKGLSNQVRTLIRYLASGLVTILMINLLELKISFIPDLSSTSWSLLIVASLIGLLNYCLHAALIDNWFYLLAIYIVFCCKKYEKYIPVCFLPEKKQQGTEATGNKNPPPQKCLRQKKDALFILSEYRLKREGTTNPKHIAMLKRFDQYITFMSFLYTSSYSMIILVAYYTLSNLKAYNWHSASMDVDLSAIMVLVFSVIFISLGLLLDVKVTKWEMWFIKNYQTNGDNPDEHPDKNLYLQSAS